MIEMEKVEKDESRVRSMEQRAANIFPVQHDTESLRLFSAAVQALAGEPDEVIYLYDMDRRLQYVSPSFEKMTGYPLADIIQTHFLDYFSPDDRERMLKAWDDVYQGRQFSGSFSCITRQKNVKRCSALWKPICNDGGCQIGVLRKEAAIGLEDSSELPYEEGWEKILPVLDSLEISYFELDLKGNFTFVNDVVCRQLGYCREELMGMNYRVYYRQDSIESARQIYRDVYRTGEPKTALNFEILKKGGDAIIIQLSVSLIRTPSGEPKGFRGMAINITERIRKEQLFQETSEKFKTVLETMEEGYLETDLKGSYTYVNDAACRLLGFSRDEIIGKNYRMLQPPDIAESIKRVHQRIYHTAKPEFLVDTQAIRKDGSVIILQTNIALAWNKKGEASGFCILARDITESKKALEALRESEEKYRNVLENMDEGLFETDLTGDYTFLNDAACRLVGYERQEIIGKKYPILHDPETVRYLKDIYSRMYKTGTIERLLDYEAVRKDGSVRVHQANTAFVKNNQGEITGFRALVRDITENKMAEEALRRSEERYRTILDTMDESYAEYDLKGNITFINAAGCRFLGYDLSEMIGMNFRKCHTKDMAGFIEKVFRGIYQTGRPQLMVDYELIRKDGDIRIGELNAALLRDGSGKPKGFRVLSRDVTERKKADEEKAKMAQQLLQAQKMESVGRLAGGVAHDFNNMITVILGYAEMIRLRLPQAHPLLKDIHEIEKAAARSRDITRQLLAFSRKAIIEPRNINLNNLIAGTQKTILRLLGEDIDLKFYPGDHLWKIKVDPSQIEHVLINLAVNARDAMANGGKLTIETENISLNKEYCMTHPGFISGSYVMLGISDDGVGMDKETLNQIFEPFFTTKDIGKGTGLGLAMVYGVIKQNNGFINVYSEPGRGTTFKIYLPQSPDEAVIKDEVEEVPATVVGGTILLVEDDEMVRNLTTDMLEAIGYKTVSAGSPQEALLFFKDQNLQIDLMITDVVMPKMSGRELAERIAVMRPGIRVLFMSGYTTNVIAHRGVLDEGVNFIQKPFSMGDLARKIHNVMK